MSKDEGYSEPLDEWVIGADCMGYNEQELTVKTKKTSSGFGKNVITSGRAEWDLRIDFESFGGICIGVYKHNKLSSRDDLTELPINSHFAKSKNGWGYTNKNGATTHSGERKKFGNKYKSGDTLTMSLDLLAGTLSYSINGESQGLAYDVPRGAYRLACKLQFKEQKVSILRFWTSLPRTNAAASPKEVETEEPTTSHMNGTSNVQQNGTTNNSNNNDNDDNSNNTNINDSSEIPEDNKEDDNDNNDSNDNNDNTENNENNENNENTNETTTNETNDDDDDDDDENDDDNNNNNINSNEPDENDLDNNIDPNYDFDKHHEQPTAEQSRQVKKSVKKQHKSEANTGFDSANNSGDEQESLQIIGGGLSRERSSSQNGNDEKSNSSNSMEAPEPISVSVKDNDTSSDYFNVSGTNLSTEKPKILSCIREQKGVPHSGFGQQLLSQGRSEWILKILKGHNIVIGVSGTTKHSDGLFTDQSEGYGYCDDGNILWDGCYIEYNAGYKQGDTVGVHLDMYSGDLRFSVNGIDQGPAFSGLKLDPKNDVDGYRLAVSLQYRPHSVQLDTNTSWTTKRVSPRPGRNDVGFSYTVPHQRKLSWIGTSKKSKDKDKESKDDEKDASYDKKNNNLKGNDKLSVTTGNKSPNSKKKRPKSARKAPKSPRNVDTKTKNIKPSAYRTLDTAKWEERQNATDTWERCGTKLDISANKNSVNAKNDIKDGHSAFGKLIVKDGMKVRWDIKIDQGSRVALGVMNMEGKSQPATRKLLNTYFSSDLYGYGYFGNDGQIARTGRFKQYAQSFKRGDIISVILNLYNKQISFLKNGEDQGVAFTNIPVGEYHVAMALPKNRHKVTLQKVQIWDAK